MSPFFEEFTARHAHDTWDDARDDMHRLIADYIAENSKLLEEQDWSSGHPIDMELGFVSWLSYELHIVLNECDEIDDIAPVAFLLQKIVESVYLHGLNEGRKLAS